VLLDPRAEYTKRWKHRSEVARRYRLWDARYGYARLSLAVLCVAMGWFVFGAHSAPLWWLAVPVAGFIALVAIHDKAQRLMERAERASAFYRRGLDRLEGKWQGRGECGDRYLNDKHPYAGDLDLFGRGSLFELLCTARTLAGRRTLAWWLLHPADPAEVRARQEAVEELRDRLDLREDLALMGEAVRRGVHAGALPRWGEAEPILDSPLARGAVFLVSAAVAAGFVAVLIHAAPLATLVAPLAAAAGLGLFWRSRVLRVAAEVEQPSHDLDILAELLRRLEQERFQCRKLRELREKLSAEGQPPSKRIAKLGRLVELLDSREHLLMQIVGPLLLWTTQLAFAIEAWRKKTGPHLREWLRAVGQFEALCALAGYAFEHPNDPFPEFTPECSCFDGRGLGHPLIPEDRCVRNDVRLNQQTQVLLVSGSNMSGKSTLLRTVGVNAVLAMTGAPVRAESLRLSPLKIGASIRVTDSLRAGMSRFYAEIKRIRQIMDMAAEDGTVLFLLDELLHGTNSHDRRIGAEAIVKKLVECGGIGLVTTHDLAIAHIEDEMGPRVRNVHFQDRMENGRMSFDYKLRPGVVEHSNAIELMRSVGLEV